MELLLRAGLLVEPDWKRFLGSILAFGIDTLSLLLSALVTNDFDFAVYLNDLDFTRFDCLFVSFDNYSTILLFASLNLFNVADFLTYG